MFERYTEKARRIIFFARYEASQLASAYIETEHLLLGLIQEDRELARRLLKTGDVIDAVRGKLRERRGDHPTSTSVDLPLSHESKRVLAYGAEEAERMQSQAITPGHLLLGMLREEKSVAAKVLGEHGVRLAEAREMILHPPTAG